MNDKEREMAKLTGTAQAVWMVAMIALLAGCGESEQAKPAPPPPPPPPPVPHTVGGSVSGLPGSGLVLQLNGANDLPVSANGKFNFPKTLARGSAYTVSVKTSPSAPVKQTCKVDQGAGKIANANISNVAVTCTTVTFAVGGTVSGLAGKGKGKEKEKKLVLQLNGANDLTIANNGKFVFPAVRLPDGSDYSVSIKTMPARQKCTIKPVSLAFDRDTLNIVSVTCSKTGRRR
jgi:predicted component of type VI protein secretion system